MFVLRAAAAAPELRLSAGVDGHPRLSAGASGAEVISVESTADLRVWTERFRAHGSFEGIPDLAAGDGAGFYRAAARPRTAADDWKNVVGGPGEPFQSEAPPPWNPAPRWIKFALLLDPPGRVVFQDSTRYAFHYDFARVRIPEFAGMSRAGFDAVTLRTNGQRAVLGAVMFPPSTNVAEIGIQFVGLDPYPREQVAAWFEAVRAMIQVPPATAVFYLPTFEQAEVARAHRAWLSGRGIEVASAGRWVTGDECYAPGWAVGRLVSVPGQELAAAYREGRLRPDDVLLTDAVPAEVPPLAGIVTQTPATPNSHVAILAQSFGIPFAYPADPGLAASLPAWAAAGREVMVRVRVGFRGCELVVAPIEGGLDETVRAALRELRKPPVLELPPLAVAGSLTLPAQGLRPADIGIVGGKAANFGVLRRKLPTNSPSPALAVTFDLWRQYLDQPSPVAGGGTLREAIARRVGGFAWPPDMAALQNALAEVRGWFTDATDFDPAQRAAVLGALQAAGFAPDRNIRFRSSTNVEDSERFSGAGLYDSYSGCLADDLDADTRGPSACDPAEERERGVFRALRKVYASFYNDNAFLERLRHGVDESRVGMAVLVHPSTPDAFEEANGVATLTVHRDPQSRSMSGSLVTQAGAVSVSNPDSAAVPESVDAFLFGSSIDVSLRRQSSLVPLGGTVLRWPAEYRELVRLLNLGALGYEAEFPARGQFTLDFEYKREAPGSVLMIKQVREVPAAADGEWVPWLMNTGGEFEILQGEHGGVFAKHRLKSVWRFAVRATPLNDAGVAVSPFTRLEAEWRDGPNPAVLAGSPESLPGYRYQRAADVLADRWSSGSGAGLRTFELRLTRVKSVPVADGPLLTLADHALEWTVTYATPQPTWDYLPSGTYGPTNTLRESVTLTRMPPVSPESHRQDRRFQHGKALVETSFWWPPEPKGPSAGYTAPVQAWIETRITGLTSRPLVLRSRWSQTYQPGHHNFWEEFLFEPRLEPGIDPDLLAELDAAGVRALWINAPRDDWNPVVWRTWRLDGSFREL